MKKAIKKAFTLIELLVVIAIIGILSGLIVVSMSGVTQKANLAKAQAFSNSLRNSLMLNLISEWKLDDIIGTAAPYTTPDSWNGGNTGTLYDGTSTNCSFSGTVACPQKVTSNCVYGNCLSFDGSNDYVDCGTGTNINFSSIDSYSLSLWIKTTASTGYILSRASGAYPYSLTISSKKARIYIYDGTFYPYATTTSNIDDNIWHHIVAIKDYKNDNLKIYLDGSLQDTQPDTTTGEISRPSANTYIGKFSSNYFTGLIDEIRIYNAVNSISQIKEQYQTGLNNLLTSGQITREDYQNRLLGIK